MDENFMDSLDYLAIPNIIVISGYEMLKIMYKNWIFMALLFIYLFLWLKIGCWPLLCMSYRLYDIRILSLEAVNKISATCLWELWKLLMTIPGKE